jgi:hypothetical protein
MCGHADTWVSEKRIVKFARKLKLARLPSRTRRRCIDVEMYFKLIE